MPLLAASATIASGVPAAPLPSPRAVLKKATEKLAIDTPSLDEEVLRRVEGGGAVDADEVELGARRHLVDDLGDRRAVVGVAAQAGGAFVVRRSPCSGCRRAPGWRRDREAEVDDRDLDPGAVDARGVPRGGAGRRRPLAGGRERHGRRALRDVLHGARRGERLQPRARHARLEDAAAGGAHVGGARAPQGGASGGGVAGEQAHARAAASRSSPCARA